MIIIVAIYLQFFDIFMKYFPITLTKICLYVWVSTFLYQVHLCREVHKYLPHRPLPECIFSTFMANIIQNIYGICSSLFFALFKHLFTTPLNGHRKKCEFLFLSPHLCSHNTHFSITKTRNTDVSSWPFWPQNSHPEWPTDKGIIFTHAEMSKQKRKCTMIVSVCVSGCCDVHVLWLYCCSVRHGHWWLVGWYIARVAKKKANSHVWVLVLRLPFTWRQAFSLLKRKRGL